MKLIHHGHSVNTAAEQHLHSLKSCGSTRALCAESNPNKRIQRNTWWHVDCCVICTAQATPRKAENINSIYWWNPPSKPECACITPTISFWWDSLDSFLSAMMTCYWKKNLFLINWNSKPFLIAQCKLVEDMKAYHFLTKISGRSNV